MEWKMLSSCRPILRGAGLCRPQVSATPCKITHYSSIQIRLIHRPCPESRETTSGIWSTISQSTPLRSRICAHRSLSALKRSTRPLTRSPRSALAHRDRDAGRGQDAVAGAGEGGDAHLGGGGGHARLPQHRRGARGYLRAAPRDDQAGQRTWAGAGGRSNASFCRLADAGDLSRPALPPGGEGSATGGARQPDLWPARACGH